MSTANAMTVMGGGTNTVNLASAEGPQNEIRVKRIIEEKIRKRKVNQFPFMRMAEKVRAKTRTGNMKFEWMQSFNIPRTVKVTIAASASATTLVVDNVDCIVPRMLLFNPLTGEQLHVTDRYGWPSTSLTAGQITVARAFGQCSAGAITAGTTLILTSPMGEESQLAFKGVSRGVDADYLYTQETGWGAGISNWADMRDMLGGGEKDRINSQAVDRFKEIEEAKLLFGIPGYSATGGADGGPAYSSAGLMWFCRYSGNVIDMNGMPNYDAYGRGMTKILKFATTRKMIAFCGMQYLNRLSGLSEFRNRMRSSPESKTLGFEIETLTFPKGGKLMFVPHEMMDEPGVERTCLVTSLDDLRLRWHEKFTLTKDVQDNGRHAKEWEMRSNEGLEHTNTLGCGMFING